MMTASGLWVRQTVNGVVRAARDVARLVVPVECAGCGLEDVPLCQRCAALWWEAPVRVESDAPRLDIDGAEPWPVWAIAVLADEAHAAIAAWKDHDRRDLDRVLPVALGRAAHHCAIGLPPGPVSVVPAPARRSSTRRRGVNLPRLLAAAVVGGLRAAGGSAQLADVLVIGAGESRRASARERWRSASRTVRVRGRLPPTTVLLVDDVLTTGATLAACDRALTAAGHAVAAGFVLAAAGSGRPDPVRTLRWGQDEVVSTTFDQGR